MRGLMIGLCLAVMLSGCSLVGLGGDNPPTPTEECEIVKGAYEVAWLAASAAILHQDIGPAVKAEVEEIDAKVRIAIAGCFASVGLGDRARRLVLLATIARLGVDVYIITGTATPEEPDDGTTEF